MRREHTPFQWAVQRALYTVAPYGEARADLRAAMMTANLMAMQMEKAPDDMEFSRIINSLRTYLKTAGDYRDEADIEAATRIEEEKECQELETS